VVKAETGNVIKVLFFASLRERLGCQSLDFPYQPNLTVAELKAQLKAKGDTWQQALEGAVLAAVDQDMVDDDRVIADNAEVAFFPPVTGG
jgi:molybdopterin synthase sulfur carrier subunit